MATAQVPAVVHSRGGPGSLARLMGGGGVRELTGLSVPGVVWVDGMTGVRGLGGPGRPARPMKAGILGGPAGMSDQSVLDCLERPGGLDGRLVLAGLTRAAGLTVAAVPAVAGDLSRLEGLPGMDV